MWAKLIFPEDEFLTFFLISFLWQPENPVKFHV
jgi:hypothetical protein